MLRRLRILRHWSSTAGSAHGSMTRELGTCTTSEIGALAPQFYAESVCSSSFKAGSKQVQSPCARTTCESCKVLTLCYAAHDYNRLEASFLLFSPRLMSPSGAAIWALVGVQDICQWPQHTGPYPELLLLFMSNELVLQRFQRGKSSVG